MGEPGQGEGMSISRFQLIAATAALGFATAAAFADDVYQAKGMPVGGFRIFPTLDLVGLYDDNVYKQDQLTISSAYFIQRPEVRVASQWVRHEFDIYGGGEFFEYTDTPSENQSNWNVGANGRYDIYNGVDFIADASYQVLHEPRTDPDLAAVSGFPAKPNLYKRGLIDGAFEYHPYHFAFSVGGSYQRLDYSPTALVGGTFFPNSDRNSNMYTVWGSAGYEFSPGYAVFTKLTYNDRTFDKPINRLFINAASNGFNIDVGLDARVTNLITGNIYIGYLEQNYKGALGNVTGVDFGAQLKWTPAEEWLITIDASHTLNNTVVAGTTEDNSTIKVTADLSVRPYLVLEGQAYYLNSDFSNAVPKRQDNYFGVGVFAKYILNDYMAIKAGYNYEQRTSNAAVVPKQDFSDNQFQVALLLQE